MSPSWKNDLPPTTEVQRIAYRLITKKKNLKKKKIFLRINYFSAFCRDRPQAIFKKEEGSSASIKEGGDREDEENNEEDYREEIEILEEDQ